MPGFFGSLIAAHNNPGRIKVVVKRLGLTKKLGTEKNLLLRKAAAGLAGVSDGNGGLDDDGRFLRAVFRDLRNKLNHGIHGRTVKVIGFRVIVCRRGNNNEIRIPIGAFRIRRDMQMETALPGPCFFKIFFDVLVLNRADQPVQALCLFGGCGDCCDLMVLGEQNRERQPHISHPGNRNAVGPVDGHGGRGGILCQKIGNRKAENTGERLQLLDRWHILAVFEVAEHRAVDPRTL